MRFKYYKLSLPRRSDFFGSEILKPIIPVAIFIGDKRLDYAALIDSGADFCIFHGEIGEYLGLDIPSGIPETFGGVQDAAVAKAFIHEVTVNVGGWNYKINIGFSYDVAKYGYGILGQRGFFDIFVVKFALAKEEIASKERS